MLKAVVLPRPRKNNNFFLLVGMFKGKYIERSTHTYDELEATRMTISRRSTNSAGQRVRALPRSPGRPTPVTQAQS
jgi:hypothetical protein